MCLYNVFSHFLLRFPRMSTLELLVSDVSCFKLLLVNLKMSADGSRQSHAAIFSHILTLDTCSLLSASTMASVGCTSCTALCDCRVSFIVLLCMGVWLSVVLLAAYSTNPVSHSRSSLPLAFVVEYLRLYEPLVCLFVAVCDTTALSGQVSSALSRIHCHISW